MCGVKTFFFFFFFLSLTNVFLKGMFTWQQRPRHTGLSPWKRLLLELTPNLQKTYKYIVNFPKPF